MFCLHFFSIFLRKKKNIFAICWITVDRYCSHILHFNISISNMAFCKFGKKKVYPIKDTGRIEQDFIACSNCNYPAKDQKTIKKLWGKENVEYHWLLWNFHIWHILAILHIFRVYLMIYVYHCEKKQQQNKQTIMHSRERLINWFIKLTNNQRYQKIYILWET